MDGFHNAHQAAFAFTVALIIAAFHFEEFRSFFFACCSLLCHRAHLHFRHLWLRGMHPAVIFIYLFVVCLFVFLGTERTRKHNTAYKNWKTAQNVRREQARRPLLRANQRARRLYDGSLSWKYLPGKYSFWNVSPSNVNKTNTAKAVGGMTSELHDDTTEPDGSVHISLQFVIVITKSKTWLMIRLWAKNALMLHYPTGGVEGVELNCFDQSKVL